MSGAIVDIVWFIKLSALTGVYELLPAFIVGFVFSVVVSLLDKKPSAEIEKIFEIATDKNNDD